LPCRKTCWNSLGCRMRSEGRRRWSAIRTHALDVHFVSPTPVFHMATPLGWPSQPPRQTGGVIAVRSTSRYGLAPPSGGDAPSDADA
jgi:hypothetical protein